MESSPRGIKRPRLNGAGPSHKDEAAAPLVYDMGERVFTLRFADHLMEVRERCATLYGLVAAIFHHFLGDRRLESLETHLWSVDVEGPRNELGGSNWCSSRFVSAMHWDAQRMCAPKCPVPLTALSLRERSLLHLVYDQDHWSIEVVKMTLAPLLAEPESDPGDASAYKYLGKEPVLLSPLLPEQLAALLPEDPPPPLCAVDGSSSEDGFLTAEEIDESRRFRAKYEAYASNPNEWSRRQRCMIKPNPPDWSKAELAALTDLIEAGWTFTKAWKTYLDPTLLTRSKGTASGKWYTLKGKGRSSALKKPSPKVLENLRHVRVQSLKRPCVKIFPNIEVDQADQLANYRTDIEARGYTWDEKLPHGGLPYEAQHKLYYELVHGCQVDKDSIRA